MNQKISPEQVKGSLQFDHPWPAQQGDLIKATLRLQDLSSSFPLKAQDLSLHFLHPHFLILKSHHPIKNPNNPSIWEFPITLLLLNRYFLQHHSLLPLDFTDKEIVLNVSIPALPFEDLTLEIDESWQGQEQTHFTFVNSPNEFLDASSKQTNNSSISPFQQSLINLALLSFIFVAWRSAEKLWENRQTKQRKIHWKTKMQQAQRRQDFEEIFREHKLWIPLLKRGKDSEDVKSFLNIMKEKIFKQQWSDVDQTQIHFYIQELKEQLSL